jgi:hypothetical protein
MHSQGPEAQNSNPMQPQQRNAELHTATAMATPYETTSTILPNAPQVLSAQLSIITKIQNSSWEECGLASNQLHNLGLLLLVGPCLLDSLVIVDGCVPLVRCCVPADEEGWAGSGSVAGDAVDTKGGVGAPQPLGVASTCTCDEVCWWGIPAGRRHCKQDTHLSVEAVGRLPQHTVQGQPR